MASASRIVEPELHRRTYRRTDWGRIAAGVGGLILFAGVVMAYSLALMIFTTIIVKGWDGPRYALSYPTHASGTVTTLGVLCAKAAAEGTLSGDLLIYCQ